jgi:hypothetical protein
MNLLRVGGAVLTTVLASTVVLVGAVPAQAASDYRFWSYWYAGADASSWTYAPVGPAGHRVDDGAVVGWHFGVATPNPSAPPPRTSAASAFDRICSGTARPEGKDRVALVVDFGTAGDAPPGEHPPSSSVRGTCVVVPDRSTGLTVLGEAGYAVRRDGSGLVCGLQGYPKTECGVVVKASPSSSPKPTTKPTPEPTRSPSKPTTSRTADPVKPGEPTPDSPTRTTSASTAPSPGEGSTSATPEASQPDESPSTEALAVGPPPEDPGGSSGSPLGLLLGVTAVTAVAGAAVWRGRSGRQPT